MRRGTSLSTQATQQQEHQQRRRRSRLLRSCLGAIVWLGLILHALHFTWLHHWHESSLGRDDAAASFVPVRTALDSFASTTTANSVLGLASAGVRGGGIYGGIDQHGIDQHGIDQHGIDQHGIDQHIDQHGLSAIATNQQNGSVDEASAALGRFQRNQDQRSYHRPQPYDPRKPSIVIHIGPSKTATTTIQKQFVHLKDQLQKDSYLYVGRYVGIVKPELKPLLQGRCYKQYFQNALNMASAQSATATVLTNNQTEFVADASHVFHSNVTCWRDLVRSLEKLRRNQTSIIFSDESYSYRTMWGDNGPYLQPQYFQTLQTLLKDWNVIVVVGYRRYAEWLLSAAKENNVKMMEGKDLSFDGWPHEGGKAPRAPWSLIGPWMAKRDQAGTYKYLDASVRTWKQGGFVPSVLNLHDRGDADRGNADGTDHGAKQQQQSPMELHAATHNPNLMAQFVCKIIRNAPHTCRHVKQGKLSLHAKENKANGDLSIYSTLVFEAAKQALAERDPSLGPDTTMSRHNVTQDLMHYHQKELGMTKRDLPLLCPTTDQLMQLLDMTKKKEHRFVPGWHEGRRTLDVKLWDRLEFCGLDWHRLLDDKPTWQQLLQRLRVSWR